jgi:hypothetical protein
MTLEIYPVVLELVRQLALVTGALPTSAVHRNPFRKPLTN